jgi:hypothetical protein
MKIKILGLFASLLMAGNLFGAPFLVSASYPAANNVTSFTLSGIGTTAITVPALVNADGSTQLHLDLGLIPLGSFTAGLPNGTQNVTATATNQFGVISAASAPFTFIKATPGAPTGLSLSLL